MPHFNNISGGQFYWRRKQRYQTKIILEASVLTITPPMRSVFHYNRIVW